MNPAIRYGTYIFHGLIVSLLYVLANGASAEISIVGNEGAIGVALFMGGVTTKTNRAIVQSGGYCVSSDG